MLAPFALYVTASRKSWVLDTLRVNMKIFSTHRIVSPVHTIVHLVAFLGALRPITKFALILQVEMTVILVFLWL